MSAASAAWEHVGRMGEGCGPHGSRATAEGGLEGVSGRDSWGRGGTLKTLCMLGRKGLGSSRTCCPHSGGNPWRDRAWKRGGGAGYEEVCLGVGGGGVGVHQ